MKDFLDAGFRPEYIALRGLPIAGAVAAKGIISGKVANEQLLKSPASDQPGVGRGLAEVVCGDTGQTDLLDFQYAAFNLVALLYFFISFATTSAVDPSKGLPTIPPTLLSLTGVSTLAYLAKKQLETGLAPVITSVTPMRVLLGTDPEIQITGDGFYAQGKPVNTTFNQVLIDGRPLPARDWERTSVAVLLPTGLDRSALEALGWKENSAADLVVRDDSGTSSPAVKLDVQLPAAGAPAAPAPAAVALASTAPAVAPLLSRPAGALRGRASRSNCPGARTFADRPALLYLAHGYHATAGASPPMRRAARWDGAIPAMGDFATGRPPDVREVRDLVLFLHGCRKENGLADKPFDIVIGGTSPAGLAGRDLVGPLADLGVTWWVERLPWGDDLGHAKPILRRIEQGPPRI